MSRRLFFIFWMASVVFRAGPGVWAAGFSVSTAPASLLVEGWKHRVFLVYPPEKVKSDEVLQEQSRGEVIRLKAAKGEVEPFLLVLRTEVPMRGVEVRLSALKGDGGGEIPASEPARSLGYIHVDEPSGTRIAQRMPFETGVGLYPDPLLKGPAAVRPGHNLQFWVPVSVPRNTRAGVYRGEVTLTFRREGWMPAGMNSPVVLPVEVTVRDFALPERSPLLNTAFYSSSQLSGGRLAVDGHALCREFASHRQTPEPLLPSPLLRVLPGGELEVDLSEWEKEAAFVLEEMGLPQVFLPVWGSQKGAMQGLYFLWHYPAVASQRWPAFPLPGQPGAYVCDAEGALTQEFVRLFGAYLRQVNALVERRGWKGRVLLSTMDEPYTAHLSGESRERDMPENNYRVIRNFVALVREAAPALRTFCTANPVPELEGQVDQWCLRNLEAAGSGRFPQPKDGSVLTLCDNYRTFIDYPMVAPRTLGWLCWKTGAKGWLTFETMGDLARAWQEPVLVYPQFKGGTVWGMGLMFYPEPVGSGLLTSLRWEMMRKGAEDYEYLSVLEGLLNSLPSAKQALPLVQEARNFLAHAADGIAGVGSELETSTGPAQTNTQTQQAPHRVRESAGDWIERISKL